MTSGCYTEKPGKPSRGMLMGMAAWPRVGVPSWATHSSLMVAPSRGHLSSRRSSPSRWRRVSIWPWHMAWRRCYGCTASCLRPLDPSLLWLPSSQITRQPLPSLETISTMHAWNISTSSTISSDGSLSRAFCISSTVQWMTWLLTHSPSPCHQPRWSILLQVLDCAQNEGECWSEHGLEWQNGQLGAPMQCNAFGHK